MREKKKKTFPGTCFLSDYDLVNYQNAKMHANNLHVENMMILLKPSILRVFELIT